MKHGLLRVWALSLLAMSSLTVAEIRLVDALGAEIVLAKPAERIVALAPHLVEQAYSAGAGAQLVGAVNYSDYPAAAKKLPQVGSYEKVNYEALVALQPDLVLAWESAGGQEIQQRLQALGIPVFVSDSNTIADVATGVRTIGKLSGNEQQAEAAANTFLDDYQHLVAANRQKTHLTVFYELWHEPLLTANGKHVISEALAVCGGINIFADALPLIPKVNLEAVIRADPDVIVAVGMDGQRPEWLDNWQQWPQMKAVRHGALYSVHPDYLHRHSMRLLQGVAELCRAFDDARVKINS